MRISQRKWLQECGWEVISPNDIRDEAQVVFVFGDRELIKDERRIGEIREFHPNAHLFGCSTAGEIAGTNVHDRSLVVTALQFEHTKVKFAKASIVDMDASEETGVRLAKELSGERLRHIIVLSDGLKVNGSGLAKGMAGALPSDVAVTGGLAGDRDRFTETLVISGDAPSSGVIAAMGLYGERLKVGFGSMGGWDSFGPDRTVTRSKNNIVYELDGRSALELYKQYLGELAKGLPATGLLFPLSLRLHEGEQILVRTILGINPEDGSMTFAGDVPQGSSVRLMKANFDRLIDGAIGAAELSKKFMACEKSEFALLISCIGRKLVLKQRIEEEIEGVRDVLGRETVMTGFYSYGELCPIIQLGKQCELHNQTMTITTLCET